jgi:RNase H-like domain found in reverse transcriptase
MCSNLVLAYYNPELPIVLTCDDSKYGLGAVISHIMPDGANRPIAFASRTLSSAEINYSQIYKEALGIVWGVKKFFYYLAGRRFKLITDHKPLLSIFRTKKNLPSLVATRLLHYAIFLQKINYDIEYKPSKAISNTDGLSRLPVISEDLVTYDQGCRVATDVAIAMFRGNFNNFKRDRGKKNLKSHENLGLF